MNRRWKSAGAFPQHGRAAEDPGAPASGGHSVVAVGIRRGVGSEPLGLALAAALFAYLARGADLSQIALQVMVSIVTHRLA
jgi:hypothetical protein